MAIQTESHSTQTIPAVCVCWGKNPALHKFLLYHLRWSLVIDHVLDTAFKFGGRNTRKKLTEDPEKRYHDGGRVGTCGIQRICKEGYASHTVSAENKG